MLAAVSLFILVGVCGSICCFFPSRWCFVVFFLIIFFRSGLKGYIILVLDMRMRKSCGGLKRKLLYISGVNFLLWRVRFSLAFLWIGSLIGKIFLMTNYVGEELWFSGLVMELFIDDMGVSSFILALFSLINLIF